MTRVFFVKRFRLSKSCISIFTHGQTPITQKQLIMHVEVMLRNMVRLHRWISVASVSRCLEPLMKPSTAGLRRQL